MPKLNKHTTRLYPAQTTRLVPRFDEMPQTLSETWEEMVWLRKFNNTLMGATPPGPETKENSDG